MDGWISVYRKIQENAWYKDSEYVHVWLHLLLNANHTDKKLWINGKEILLKRGQLLTSRKSISEKTGVTQSKIYRILKRYENEQQIEQQKTNKYTIITILNYNEYQKSEQQIEQQMNNKWTTNEQQMNTNNNVNNNIPIITTNNNINNNILENKGYGEKKPFVDCFTFCEKEYGRTLSPTEVLKLKFWKDNWFKDDRIINLAISKSTLNGVKALAYTEKIINSWHDKGYKTYEECANENIRYKKKNEGNKQPVELYEYDWLNED